MIVSLKVLKKCMEKYKTIFTSFGKNAAEFYDKHILLTLLRLFWPEYGLKPHYLAA